MKVCPVCSSRCFDDMHMCFGCLHRFDDSDEHDSTDRIRVLPVPGAETAPGLISPIGSPLGASTPDLQEYPARPDVEEPPIALPQIDMCSPTEQVIDIQCGTSCKTAQLSQTDSADHTDSTGQTDLATPKDSAGASLADEVGVEQPFASNVVSEAERSKRMLLVVDIGNTHTVLGLFEGQQLEKTWRVTTNKGSTHDEVNVLLTSLFQSTPWSLEDIDGSALASVVPRLTEAWRHCLFAIAGQDPVLCTIANADGLLETDYPNPQEIGQDRIADVLAARAQYGQPVIVVDFGTATNIEIVDERGRFCGGIIAPGVETSMKALFSSASKLSMVDLDDPVTVIGKNTTHAIQSGIVFGEAERVDGLLRRIFEELGYEPTVIATGGLAGLMVQHSHVVSITDNTLTLQGLRLLYEHVVG